MFKIATEKLLLVAGVVWFLAGVNIFALGIGAYLGEQGWIIGALLLGTLIIYVIFHIFIFTKMVKKHDGRIRGYEDDRTHILKFFDAKGYVIMAIMMGGGITLRVFNLVPHWFIAFFYTGLGAALAVAGISFILRYIRSGKTSCPVVPKTDSNQRMR